MGVKERRERERIELKQNILAAAREIALQQGWNAVTIRKVADIVEYSPPAIYDYFDSKDSILQELIREAMGQLVSGMKTAFNSTDQPEEQLVRLGLAYAAFAWDHPELYQLLNGLRGADCKARDQAGSDEIHLMFFSAFTGALPNLAHDHKAIYALLDINRATLNGLITLIMNGQMVGGRERSLYLIEHSIRQIIRCNRDCS